MKVVEATVSSTLILWSRDSLLESPTVVPASTVPCRCTAPVRARIASSSVVLPLWNGPTSAMHRGPVGRLPFCAMCFSHLGPSLLACRWTLVSNTRGDWQEPLFLSCDSMEQVRAADEQFAATLARTEMLPRAQLL